MDRVACFIVNYNMAERCDALCDYIAANVKSPIDVIVIDNGSDLQPPSKYTALRLDENVQTTNGWLMGLHYAAALARKRGTPYFAYWFLITSAEFVPCSGDPLAPLLKLLHLYSDAACVHPALSADSTTSWEHLKTIGMPGGYRRVNMIDNIASLYRAEWFDSIGRFDPSLTYAWGIDIETCWKARRDGRTVWVSEPATVKKVTNIGYSMDRMRMTASDREQKAGAQMREVLSARYGADWWNRMLYEYE